MFQKLVLAQFVDDAFTSKANWTKMVFEAAKPYMNVELYKYEQEMKDREANKNVPQQGVNSIYEEMVKVGRATGKFWLPEGLAKSMKELEEKGKTKVLDLQQPLDLAQLQASREDAQETEELG